MKNVGCVADGWSRPRANDSPVRIQRRMSSVVDVFCGSSSLRLGRYDTLTREINDMQSDKSISCRQHSLTDQARDRGKRCLKAEFCQGCANGASSAI